MSKIAVLTNDLQADLIDRVGQGSAAFHPER